MPQLFEDMDLVGLRNIFLQEMRDYLKASDFETSEELKVRRDRIKHIDKLLEEKKKATLFKDF